MSSIAVALCISFAAATNSSVKARQLPEPPLPTDPRPIGQLLSESEKAMLAEAHKSSKVVETYLRISDAHLQAAFAAIRVNNSRIAERELDIYNKALAEAGKSAFEATEGKRRLAKTIEQTVYRQIKTLESIDQLFPSEREAFSEAALKHAKQIRVQALNQAFASGGVLKEPDEEEKEKPRNNPPTKEPPPKKPALPLPFALRSVAFLSYAGPCATSEMTGSLCGAMTELPLRRFGTSRVSFERSSFQIPGDYLTEEEDDHVREAQAAPDRVKVFMKIADRRIKAIVKLSSQPTDQKDEKKPEDESREWGVLPKLSRAELLRHYAKAIAECMAKLEDAYERNPKSAALPKALGTLRNSTDKHLQILRTLAPEMKGESEAAALRDAIDQADIANKGARGGLSKDR